MAFSLVQEAYKRRALEIALGSIVPFDGDDENRSLKNERINKPQG
jgi:hypothetical protein